MLTRNEERTIARALRSLPIDMPVFVLDAESADNTVVLATELGARVERRGWTGFVDARRYAVSRVKTPWTFMLDADEALDPRLAQALAGAPEDAEAYIVRRTSWFCGRPIRRWTGEPLVRLFRTDRARLEAHPETRGSADVHERWIVDGPVGELAGSLVHYSYPSIATYRQKFAEYTTLESLGLRTSVPRLCFVATRAVARFLAHLLLRGMLLDGWRGLYVGFWSELYPVVVHWKALRLR
ncbi:MAG TPA: glycosyltransferase family 2 protein [Candidatus Binatia bacterium]|nr:glycosyltransferase family 2 protein [Candidatus Binatia bacterium]